MTTAWVLAFLSLALAVVLLGFLTLGMARQLETVLNAQESSRTEQGLDLGLPLGTRVTGLASGVELSRSVLVFVDAGCTPCRQLVESLRHEVPRGDGYERLLSPLDDPNWLEPIPTGWTLLPSEPHDFQVNATPLAYLVDGNGVISARTIPNSARDIVHMIETAEKPHKKVTHQGGHIHD